jgi:hypothetical protein
MMEVVYLTTCTDSPITIEQEELQQLRNKLIGAVVHVAIPYLLINERVIYEEVEPTEDELKDFEIKKITGKIADDAIPGKVNRTFQNNKEVTILPAMIDDIILKISSKTNKYHIEKAIVCFYDGENVKSGIEVPFTSIITISMYPQLHLKIEDGTSE